MLHHRASYLFVFLALTATQLRAQSLPSAKPEDEGFSSERLAYLDRFYSDEVDKGELAGMVILVSRHGKIVHESAVGFADLEKHKKMEKDAIFRFYSMTKPITAVALMTLYEEGRFRLDDPIAKYLPEFASLRARIYLGDGNQFQPAGSSYAQFAVQRYCSGRAPADSPRRPPPHGRPFAWHLRRRLRRRIRESRIARCRHFAQGDDGEAVEAAPALPAGDAICLQRRSRRCGAPCRGSLR